MDAAKTDAATADSGTGRNVQTSHNTAARRMGSLYGTVRAARTYRKARTIIRLLGFQAVVDEGRYLTKTERLAAALTRDQGSRRPVQRRKASTRVFTMPQFAVDMIGHLPRRGSTTLKVKLTSTHQKRADARLAAPPKPRTKKKGPKSRSWDLPMQRLAARIVNEATFLRHPSVRSWHICEALDRAGITPASWSAHDVVSAMYAAVAAKRWTAPAQLNNPLGYFRFLLTSITPEQVAAHVERKAKANRDQEIRRAAARAATFRALTPKTIPQIQAKDSWRERLAAEFAAGQAASDHAQRERTTK